MEPHMDTVGLDKHIFQHTIEDQNHTYEKLVQLGIHIPNEIKRDIRSKFSVCYTNKSSIHAKSAAKGEKGRELQHYVQIYQCLCFRLLRREEKTHFMERCGVLLLGKAGIYS
ncbi:hypothetical protein J132_08283 [Termitomyces sp. J132]|nr:hypothetical protein J132_08283 [Termitomyces sp. J132]